MPFKFRVQGTLLVLAGAFALASSWSASGAETSSLTSDQNGKPDQIYTSSEAGLEFSIQVPKDWLFESGRAGYAAILRPSDKAKRLKLPGGLQADPTITIAALKKPISIDSETLSSYAQEIEEKFKKVNGSGSDFQIFQKNIVDDLPDGRKALLYYVSYKTDGAEVGQAILVSGHSGAMFRVTLSDHRINFDKNLELFYPYMTSLKFNDSAAVSREFKLPPHFALWGMIVILGGVTVGLMARARRPERPKKSRQNRQLSEINSSHVSTGHAQSHFTTTESDDESELSAAPSEFTTNRSNRDDSPESVADIPMRLTQAENIEPAFSPSDLSAPPQSIPLSYVVDENSAPPDLKKKWQIKSQPEKAALSDSDSGIKPKKD